MVAFEELENTSKYEWESISKRLKTWSTSNKMTIEEKYMRQFVALLLMPYDRPTVGYNSADVD